jgi:hypothetical protein
MSTPVPTRCRHLTVLAHREVRHPTKGRGLHAVGPPLHAASVRLCRAGGRPWFGFVRRRRTRKERVPISRDGANGLPRGLLGPYILILSKVILGVRWALRPHAGNNRIRRERPPGCSRCVIRGPVQERDEISGRLLRQSKRPGLGWVLPPAGESDRWRGDLHIRID